MQNLLFKDKEFILFYGTKRFMVALRIRKILIVEVGQLNLDAKICPLRSLIFICHLFYLY